MGKLFVPPLRNLFGVGRRGLVPPPSVADGKMLRADGTWSQTGLNYIGGSAGNAVPATATTAGDFYLITSAGTSQSKTWAVGDWAVYNGSSGSWTQITGFPTFATDAEALAGTATNKANTPASGNARALHGDMSRAVRDTIFSNGASTNRRLEYLPGTVGAVAGMAITIPFDFEVPTSNPGTTVEIAFFAPTGTNAAVARALRVALTTAGALLVRQYGATTGDTRDLSYAGFRAAYSGLRVRGMLVFSNPNSTTAPEIYLHGVDATASFSAATAGTPPNWMPTDLDTTAYVNCLNMTLGRFQPCAPIVGALTAAEALAWAQSGRLPHWCERGDGSAVAKYASDFSAGADSWSGVSSTTVDGNIDSIGGVDNVLRLTATTTACRAERTTTVTAGKRYRITGRFRYPSSNTSLARLAFVNEIGASIGWPANVGGAADTWTDFDATFTVAAAVTSLRASGLTTGGSSAITSGDIMYLKDIVIREMGPIFKPIIQPIFVVADSGLNKLSGFLQSLSPITDRKNWVIQFKTNTSGNQQLFGAGVFSATTDPTSPAHYTKNVIDDWCMNTAGTPTTTAGSASAGAQYKASGALTAARNMISLVTRVLASANLWVNSNSADDIQHTITGHVVD